MSGLIGHCFDYKQAECMNFCTGAYARTSTHAHLVLARALQDLIVTDLIHELEALQRLFDVDAHVLLGQGAGAEAVVKVEQTTVLFHPACASKHTGVRVYPACASNIQVCECTLHVHPNVQVCECTLYVHPNVQVCESNLHVHPNVQVCECTLYVHPYVKGCEDRKSTRLNSSH